MKGYKKCTNPNCQELKPLTSFYFKDKNKTKNDSICKDCKKAIRNEKYIKDKLALKSSKKPGIKIQNSEDKKKSQQLRSRRTIEPQNNQTEDVIDDINFNDLEICCDHQLTDFDKYLAVQSFNEFITILREEFGKGKNCNVYIK